MKKLRALIYARVSTTDKGQDPEMQLREMRQFTGAAGWEHMELVDLVSSRRDRRPSLDQLWKMCRRRQVDVVVVYRFDRFARSSRQLFNALEEFRRLGIQFVSLHERIDTTTAQGMLMFSIFAAFAEFERNLIAERVRSGLANAQAKGIRLGRPRLIPDVDYIGRRRAQGADWATIASELGVSISSCSRAVRRAICAQLEAIGQKPCEKQGSD